MNFKTHNKNFKLLFFSIAISFVTYGFGLTNYSLSIDSESPVYGDFSMDLGRWGTNLVRYRLFEGHTPYFTLLLGLLLLSVTAVELSKLFKLNHIYSYLFCAIFLSFPQMSYQLIFTMQADVVPLGFLLSVVGVNLFLQSTHNFFSVKSLGFFLASALVLMFVISIYQALIFLPIILFLILFLQSCDLEDFKFKNEFLKGIQFSALLILSALLYYISVKLLCPPVEGGYLSSYTSGDSSNRFSNFYQLWTNNLKGKFYYGERTYLLSSLIGMALLIKFGIQKKLFIYRFIALFFILLVPFFISFFITNNTNPPRIYVASGIVFAFLFAYFSKELKAEKIVVIACSLIFLTHLYFITQLFYSNYKIYNHDKEIAKKIDYTIQTKYPTFDANVNYVYFFGGLPYEHHEKYRLPNSEVFGGSLFSWDNGNNYRIVNFFKFTDIAYYKFIDNKETYSKIKDSMATMPIWPNPESVKMISNVIVVKLGAQKGAPLPGNIDN
ncbi:glucosyltransferase domain-containing protein [Flavobacterium phycosphaerae]|uniref:glucosyltransferase domain-containing protein n=1 Tax=Flavobacterium phycosphaerae TaxID=2697515 RepID=UPI00138989D7|nr:glucosyltransferase domain-containing protein [Flavobacterium phycosphaerae]